MRRRAVAFVGLAGLGGMIGWAVVSAVPAIEHEVALAAREAIGDGAGWASVEVSGRRVALSGRPPSEEARDKLLARLTATVGAGEVRDATAMLPLADPFVLTASRSGDALLLTGSVPSEAARKAVRDAAAAVGRNVKDETSLARGGPPDADFVAAAKRAIEQLEKLPDGTATVTGTKVALAGTARDEAAFRSLTTRTGGESGAALDVAALTPPLARPFTFTVARSGGKLVLSGHVPSGELRRTIGEIAKAAGVALEDRTALASGAPDGFSSAAAAAARAAVLLEDGRAEITDAAMKLEGRVADEAGVEAARKAASALPSGFKLAAADVSVAAVRPYRFAVERTGDSVILTGMLPSEEAKAALKAQAGRLLLGATVDDRTSVAPGAPEQFVERGSTLLKVAARLMSGKLEAVHEAAGTAATDTRLLVEGQALHAKAASELRETAAKGLGEGAVIKIGVMPAGEALGPNACQALFNRILTQEPIQFERARAVIASESAPVLDALVAAVQRCPRTMIEIAGHTDADGDPQVNDILSLDRAIAVANVLVAAGIQPDRLIPAGYGSSRPVADNATDDGKARNRRVEFIVR